MRRHNQIKLISNRNGNVKTNKINNQLHDFKRFSANSYRSNMSNGNVYLKNYRNNKYNNKSKLFVKPADQNRQKGGNYIQKNNKPVIIKLNKKNESIYKDNKEHQYTKFVYDNNNNLKVLKCSKDRCVPIEKPTTKITKITKMSKMTKTNINDDFEKKTLKIKSNNKGTGLKSNMGLNKNVINLMQKVNEKLNYGVLDEEFIDSIINELNVLKSKLISTR